MLTACVLGFVGLVAAESPAILFMKTVVQEEIVHGKPFNVTLRVFNKGEAPAFNLAIADSDWTGANWEITEGPKDATFKLSKLTAGDNATFSMMVIPKVPGTLPSAPAKVTYADSLESSDVFTHTSNDLEELSVLSLQEKYILSALWLGRVVSLNLIRTPQGWAAVAAVLVVFALVGLKNSVSKSMEVRRQTRAYEELKKEHLS